MYIFYLCCCFGVINNNNNTVFVFELHLGEINAFILKIIVTGKHVTDTVLNKTYQGAARKSKPLGFCRGLRNRNASEVQRYNMFFCSLFLSTFMRQIKLVFNEGEVKYLFNITT